LKGREKKTGGWGNLGGERKGDRSKIKADKRQKEVLKEGTPIIIKKKAEW